jgi:hypothetical protein
MALCECAPALSIDLACVVMMMLVVSYDIIQGRVGSVVTISFILDCVVTFPHVEVGVILIKILIFQSKGLFTLIVSLTIRNSEQRWHK